MKLSETHHICDCLGTAPGFSVATDYGVFRWRCTHPTKLDTCRRLDVPAALERSRSGNGGHIWIFFSDAIPASVARRLGSHVLTETMERRPDIGLDSYDRFFANQGTLSEWKRVRTCFRWELHD